MSRRLLSRRAVCGGMCGGAVLAASGLPQLGCNANAVAPAPLLISSVDDDPASPRYGQVPVTVPRFVELAAVGGAVTVQLDPLPSRERPFQVPDGGILLIHRAGAADPPEFVAVQSRCPHAGCPLGYSAADGLIECPCHGGRFLAIADAADPTTYGGKVVHRPPRADLTVWKVERAGDRVFIDLRTVESGKHLPAVANGQVVLPFEQFPQLAQPGGSVVGQPPGLADTLLVANVDGTQFVAMSAVCTHLGCLVDYDAAGKDVLCACHNSTFALDGSVTGGPAPAALRSYPVSLDGQSLVVHV